MINFDYDESMFAQLASLINSNDIMDLHRGIIGLRKLLASEINPPIQEVIDAGLIQKALEFIRQNEYPQLKL